MPASSVTTEGTAYDLLTQVESRLLARVPGFNAANCFITDNPIPPDGYFPQGALACTICLLDGVFDDRLYDGGASNQLVETSDLVVTVFTRSKIDQPPRAKVAMLHEDRGILTKHKPLVLRALLVDDPTAAILSPWHPLRDGQPFLRGSILPRRSQGPREIEGLDWLGLSLWFTVEFDWELGSE